MNLETKIPDSYTIDSNDNGITIHDSNEIITLQQCDYGVRVVASENQRAYYNGVFKDRELAENKLRELANNWEVSELVPVE